MDIYYQISEKPANIVLQDTPVVDTTDKCPICGNEIVRNGRCKTCYTCGWSSCDL